ncbi:MAG: cadherin domain-containing protein, partial [Planctomycetaceae bacterium]|nr:cadherin domain-containing protein [Planctomycetaceae bacterium]
MSVSRFLHQLKNCFQSSARSSRQTKARQRAESLETRALLSAGDLDPSFGTGGIVEHSWGSATDEAYAEAIQANGQIVVAGYSFNSSQRNMKVDRFNADGTRDTTFGVGDGLLTGGVGTGVSFATAVAIQPADQFIVVAGIASDTVFVQRLKTDGTPDSAFGGGGTVLASTGTYANMVHTMLIQPDGRIVVGGEFYSSSTGNLDSFLMRLNTDGAVDTSFGTDGIFRYSHSGNIEELHSVAIQPDGKLVIAGTSYSGSEYDAYLARVTSDGHLDASFSPLTYFTEKNDRFEHVELQPNGAIIATGWQAGLGTANVVVVRTDANGQYDSSFSGDGIQTFNFGGTYDYGLSSVLRADGKLVIAGGAHTTDTTHTTESQNLALARLNPDGSMDSSFGTAGRVTIPYTFYDDLFYGVSLQADGKLVAVGDAGTATGSHIVLARFEGTSAPTAVQLSPSYVLEQQPVGTVVGTLSSIDPDLLDSFNYALVTGSGDTNNALFTLSGNQLLTNAVFDYSVAQSYSIRIRTTDQNGKSLDHVFQVAIRALQAAELVKDISTSLTGAFPSGFAEMNGMTYFVASSIDCGAELWKSDGTATGTMMVKDIEGGVSGSHPSLLINVNGTLYFTANDGVNGYELWQSDGTDAGTTMIKDIWRGSNSASVRSLTNVNGTLYFIAEDNIHGRELWRSDGTEAGTAIVKDIYSGVNGSDPRYLANVNGTLCFTAYDGVHGWELWKSDGTEAGTEIVKDIWSGVNGAYPRRLTNVNRTLYFSAFDGVHGWELWKSDGTEAGTEMVRDIASGVNDAFPSSLTNVNGTIYFSAKDGVSGYELWKSDGTETGTTIVKNIADGGSNAAPRFLTNVNGTLYFSAQEDVHGQELWKSDGTEAGTEMVRDIASGVNGAFLSSLTNVNGTLYFSAKDGVSGYELWKSDGTETGTTIVKNIANGGRNAYPRFLTNVNGTLYFSAQEDVHGRELWKSDGTESGTVVVKHIEGGTKSALPRYLTNVNGTLYFAAQDDFHGTELWRSDGTDAGTEIVKDIMSSANGAYPRYLTNVNGTLYFSARDDVYGWELWKCDGTEAGTEVVKDIWNGVNGAYPSSLTNLSGTLYFAAYDGVHGWELWKSDGTEAGTEMVKDIMSSTDGAYPRYLTNVNGMLYFSARDDVYGWELWKSDGTEAGTVMVKDIASTYRFDSAYPRYLTNVNGTLYFSAQDNAHGRELWRSDGTETGTVIVKNIANRTNSAYPRYLTNVNGTLYFSAQDDVHATELWRSDGTESGTEMVKDIMSSTNGAYPRYLTNVSGTLYFVAQDDIHGPELWRSNGRESGTEMVKDIRSGVQWAVPRYLTNVNGTLYFMANDGTSGYELWKSDGTTAQTRIAADVMPGLDGAGAFYLLPIGNKLYFSASTNASGQELWSLTLPMTGPTDMDLSHAALPENAGTDFVIGTLSATDADPGASLSFSLPAWLGDNAAFNVSGTSLRANAGFDFETKNSYSVTVRVTDANGLSFDKQFTISVTDVNETPTNISLSHNSLAENAGANAVIGTLSGTDPDAGDTLTFSLPAGLGDNAAFNVSGTSLRANTSFDFETKNSYSVTVRVTDAGGLSFDKQFTISVTDVNENPTAISLSNASVKENLPAGTTVGTLSASDPDAGETISYSLVAGTGSTYNGSFTISGSTLKTAATFNYELKNSYSIRVRATDHAGLTVDQVFTISVQDVTELGGIDVQLGQTQRSYVRYLDVLFDRPDDIMSMVNSGRFQLTKKDLNGQIPQNVPLTASMFSLVGSRARVDFGSNGLGGNRNTTAGDGYYQLGIDMD